MRHRYPFEALHWLRQQRVDQHARAVSDQARRTLRARAEERRAEAARLLAEAHLERVLGAEAARLSAGQLRAGDLEIAGDWRRGAEAELKAKADLEAQAQSSRVIEAAAEGAARRALGQASNEAKAIDSHRQAFRAASDAAEERSQEEAATEQWSATRFPARSV